MQARLLRPAELNSFRSWLRAWEGLMVFRHDTDLVLENAEKRSYSYTWFDALDREIIGKRDLGSSLSLFSFSREDISKKDALFAVEIATRWYFGEFPPWMVVTPGNYAEDDTEESTETYSFTTSDNYSALLTIRAPAVIGVLHDLLDMLRQGRDYGPGRKELSEPCPACGVKTGELCILECPNRLIRAEVYDRLSEEIYTLINEAGLTTLLDG